MATNARRFTSASSHRIVTSIGSVGAFGPASFAVIAKFTTLVGSIWSAGTADPNYWAPFHGTSGAISFWNGSSQVDSAGSLVTTGTWYLIAITKATGSVAPRLHIYNYSTPGWNRSNLSTLANSGAPATNITIGADNGGSNPMNGDIQVGAFWNTQLSDGTLDGMVASKASWLAASPQDMWVLNQASIATPVEDEVGTADQTSITGTTVVAGNPDWSDSAVVADLTIPLIEDWPAARFGPYG